MNASIMKDPSMEALELSERTVPGKGGKAGPQGRKLVQLNKTERIKYPLPQYRFKNVFE